MALGVLLAVLGQVGASNQVPDQMQAVVQSVEVPAGERLVLKAEGRGYQVYRCLAHGAGAQWSFVAPEAKLFVNGAQVGTHSAGPMWRGEDGSAVWGEVLAKAPSLNAGSVPVLLLKAAKTEGNGIFAGVNYIQRLETSGGNAAADGCDAGHVGAGSRVPYSAVYLFYAAVK
jgi:hypothetical protein